MRLDKYLAHCGIGSRKEVKKAIRKGYVKVNDEIVNKDDMIIDENHDQIYFNDELISYQKDIYIMMNKPSGVISASEDEFEATVIDLIREGYCRKCFPVGRLDKDSEGLLLISNDGALAHRLLSPKHHVPKIYYLKYQYPLTSKDIDTLSNGKIMLDDEYVKEAHVEIIDELSCYITIYEGKFHQLKRMFHAIDNEITYLKRISMGSLVLDDNLSSGEYRFLTDEEIKQLKEWK